MAGNIGSRSFDVYRKDIGKIVSENRHQELLNVVPEYANVWVDYCKAQENNEPLSVKMVYKKKLAKIADSYKLKFTKTTANRDKLIISCLPMVVSIAKMFIGKSKAGVEMDDLIQAGNLGLVLAADNYINTPVPEGKKMASFSTFAYPWIKKYIFEESHRLATPFGGASARRAWTAVHDTTVYRQKSKSKEGDDFANDVWDDEVMNKMIDNKEVTIAADELKSFRAASKKLFDTLSKDEKKILFMAYGINTPLNNIYTQKEIAKMIGKSESTISKTISAALRKLALIAKGSNKDEELVTTLAQIHAIDLTQVPEWNFSDTY